MELVEARARGESAPAATAYTDRRLVRDVYWLNYFGPAYLARWQSRLDGVGIRRETPANGGLVIWATATPFVFDPGVKASEYPFKKPFYDALGPATFARAGVGIDSRREGVPTFDEHKRFARHLDAPIA